MYRREIRFRSSSILPSDFHTCYGVAIAHGDGLKRERFNLLGGDYLFADIGKICKLRHNADKVMKFVRYDKYEFSNRFLKLLMGGDFS